jgi:hypothetical protein
MVIADYASSNNQLTRWRSRTTFVSVTDGLSNTLLIGEKHVQQGKFGQSSIGDGSFYNSDPANQNCERAAGPTTPIARSPKDAYNRQFGSWHQNVCLFVMCDGSVHAINANIDTTNLGRLACRNDGQEITVDY